MAIDHRVGRVLFACIVGLLVAAGSYRWITDTGRAERRALEESIVMASRLILRDYLAGAGDIAISDPLNRVRAAGKVYLYPLVDGWELSGHYRRAAGARWHPYLLRLDHDAALVELVVEDDDPALHRRAAEDPRFSVSP